MLYFSELPKVIFLVLTSCVSVGSLFDITNQFSYYFLSLFFTEIAIYFQVY
jgi:hypothetical protein